MFNHKNILCFILALLLIGVLLDLARANNLPPEINSESQLYDMQYFSISIPKGWVAKEVYGHEDVKPGQDGFIVFYNNMGEHIDIFSVSFYDPQYPQYNIVVSVKSNVEILRRNNDKNINTYLLKRYFEQHDFTSFSSHDRPCPIGGLYGYESTLDVSNEQGRYLTYDGKRLDLDKYIFMIEHYIYHDYSDKEIARFNKIINSFKIKDRSINVSTISAITAEEYNNRAVDYYHQGNFTHAMSDYNKAIEIDPNYAEAYNNQGILYEKQGNLIQAMSDYSKALEINPNDAVAQYNRGELYGKQGDLTQAMSDYNKAIEIYPNSTSAYNNRGILYEKQGNLTQALSDFDKAIELDPNDAIGYNNRGVLYYKQGSYTEAISDYNKALELNPNYAEAYSSRGTLYFKQGNFTGAMSDFNKALEINPDYGEVHDNRGSVYAKQGNLTQSIRDFTKAIGIDSKDVVAYYNRAEDYYFLKDYDNAWSDVHKVETLGVSIEPAFMNALKKVSGRDQ